MHNRPGAKFENARNYEPQERPREQYKAQLHQAKRMVLARPSRSTLLPYPATWKFTNRRCMMYLTGVNVYFITYCSRCMLRRVRTTNGFRAPIECPYIGPDKILNLSSCALSYRTAFHFTTTISRTRTSSDSVRGSLTRILACIACMSTSRQ